MKPKMMHVVAVGLAMAMMLSACSMRTSAQKQETTSSPSASASQTGGKIASSLQEFAQFLLDADAKHPSMADEQKEAIERAVKNNGKLTRADYEQAWSTYRTCITSRGWTSPPVIQHGDLYGEPQVNTKGMSKEQSDRLFEDIQDCAFKYKTNVDSLYRTQVGNPGLSSDTDQLIVDCLIKNGVVPVSFTKKQYKKEMGEDLSPGEKYVGPTSFSVSDERVQSCFFAQGFYFNDDAGTSEPVWKPIS